MSILPIILKKKRWLQGAMLNQNFNFSTIIKSSVVSDDFTKYECWPSIAKDSIGRLYVVYRVPNTNTHLFESTGKIAMRISTDGGETWGGEITVIDNAGRDEGNPNILIFNDGNDEKILVTYSSWGGVAGVDMYLACVKADSGITPVFGIQTMIRENGYGASRGNPIVLSNNKIAFAHYVKNELTWDNYIVESEDFGDTWTAYEIKIAGVPTTETSLIEVKSNGIFEGKILAISRSEDIKFYKTTSLDYGHTWSEYSILTDIPVDNPNPASIIRINSNTLLLFCSPLGGGMIYKSTDEGETWSFMDYWLANGNKKYYVSALLLTNNTIALTWCTNGTISDVYFYKIKLSATDTVFTGVKEGLFCGLELNTLNNRVAVDSVNGNDFYSKGTISITEGLFGNCFQFNGVDSFLYHPTLFNVYPDEFSLSIWFNLDDIDALRGLFLKNNFTVKDRFNCYVTTAGILGFAYEINDGGNIALQLATGVTPNTWNNLIIRWSKTTGFKSYFNYITQYSNAEMTSFPRNYDYEQFIMGYLNSSLNTYANGFKGKMQQIAVWNGAVTDEDAEYIYNSGNGRLINQW